MEQATTTDKYEILQEDFIEVYGEKLYRIRTLKSFAGLDKGELGGYIKMHKNLDQSGDAWVYGNACVSGNARVYGNAQVSGNARVSGAARVYGNL